MPPGPPKPPGAICAERRLARAPAPRRRRAGRCDGAGDRSRVEAPCGSVRTARTARRPVAAGAGTRPGGRARPGAASRRSAGRPPPSAWPARRSGRRPRSRRGAGRDRGSRGNASAPRCRRARRSRGRRSVSAAPVGCRNATSVAARRRVSRAPVASPNKADRLCAAASRSRDGDRDVIDSLHLDHGAAVCVGTSSMERAGPELRGNLPGTLEGLQMIEISMCATTGHALPGLPLRWRALRTTEGFLRTTAR